jgi:hypothetical protein
MSAINAVSGQQGIERSGKNRVRACLESILQELPMHKSLNIFARAGIASALALMPAMALAQNDAAPETKAPAEAMTPEQDAAMKALPADKLAALKAWPADTQAYYWSISAERQKMFWALSDSDKVALSTMAEPQRESTWAQIEAKLKPPSA